MEIKTECNDLFELYKEFKNENESIQNAETKELIHNKYLLFWNLIPATSFDDVGDKDRNSFMALKKIS